MTRRICEILEGKTDDANKIYEKAITHYMNMKKNSPILSYQ
jgi:hypothetical protein